MPFVYIAGSFLVVFAFWGGLLALLGKLSGWTALAAKFHCDPWPEGRTFRMQSIKFNWADYNGGVTIRVCPEGLGLAIWRLFRFGHPSLFIPWSALHVVTVSDHWYGRYVVLTVDAPPIAKIRLPLNIMDSAREISAAAVSPTELPNDDPA